MVNTAPRKPPQSHHPTDQERKIHDGPCHDLKTVQNLVRSERHKAIRVVTENASSEMIDYCMDEEDLAGLVLELRSKHYHDSEWCKASPKSPWFEADAYRITKAERLPMERDLAQLKYYIKFSVNKLGNILLFFSVHRDYV